MGNINAAISDIYGGRRLWRRVYLIDHRYANPYNHNNAIGIFGGEPHSFSDTKHRANFHAYRCYPARKARRAIQL